MSSNHKDRTLVLDIQSGSVGVALCARVDGCGFVEAALRSKFPIRKHTAEELITHTLSATKYSINTLSSALKNIDQVLIIYHPPWSHSGSVNSLPTKLTELVVTIIRQHISSAPITHVSSAEIVTSVTQYMLPCARYLIQIVSEEQTEVLITRDGSLESHATLPHGTHIITRTLHTHAGITKAQVPSILTVDPSDLEETLSLLTKHMSGDFFHATKLITRSTPPDMLVVANEPYGEWLAKEFVKNIISATTLTESGTIRALRSAHFSNTLTGLSSKDIFLNLGVTYAVLESST